MLEDDDFETFTRRGASLGRPGATSTSSAASRGGSPAALLASVRDKFTEHRVRPGDIVHECREVDHNEDFVVHSHNLFVVMDKLFPRNTFTKAELAALASSLEPHGMKGFVEYKRLKDILSSSQGASSSDNRRYGGEEKWMDDDPAPTAAVAGAASFGRGSLGDWLMHAGCPAERANFQDLMSCLEMYERYSGMRISQSPDGEFVVPVGPGLKATLRFTTTK